jgi:hypothetical protein
MNNKGKNNHNYKHGKYCTKHYCIDCKKEIDKQGRSKRCCKCRNKISNPFKGKHHTKTTKLIIGRKSEEKFTEQYINKIHDKYKGTKKRDINGYVLVKDYKHSNRNSHNDILEHILIMSNFLKRPLKKGEIVHHIDFVRNNNDLKNLYLFSSRSEHVKSSASIFKLIKFLLEYKIVKFNKKSGIYLLNIGRI